MLDPWGILRWLAFYAIDPVAFVVDSGHLASLTMSASALFQLLAYEEPGQRGRPMLQLKPLW